VNAMTAGSDPDDPALQPYISIWSSLDAMHESLFPGGLDYFGHRAGWVPKARFEYYLGLLDGEGGAIAQLRSAEANAADYGVKALAVLQDQAYLDDLAASAADAKGACVQVMKD